MTSARLILQSLRHHWRAHLGVVLGSAVGSAALIGALLVGDSVRLSLREMALSRLGGIDFAAASNDRFFRDALATDFQSGATNAVRAAALLQLSATASRPDGSARANQVQVLGVDDHLRAVHPLFPGFGTNTNGVLLNQSLARQLEAKVGDTILLRVRKPSLLSREAPIAPQQDFSSALRLPVSAILSDAQLGRFSLQANQVPPMNAFVPLHLLQERVELPGRANLLVASAPGLDLGEIERRLNESWQLADGELELHALPGGQLLELRSRRVFIDPPVIKALQPLPTNAQEILTYFVNDLRVGDKATPYSMVTASTAPLVPGTLETNEVLLTDYLAEDLAAKTGDRLEMTYFVAQPAPAQLEERKATFRVAGVVPLQTGDRDLMPEFPGLAKAEKTENWDAGFPIEMSRIRPKDEQFWKDHRGTPKALLALNAGQALWTNRFGNLTALRFPLNPAISNQLATQLRTGLTPADLGIFFQPVREQALEAGAGGQDFGQLFLGFSFFLILSALILMALLFQFGLEQRSSEVGTLLALGFRPRQVRQLLLAEGLLLSAIGGVLGVAGGIFYARSMLHGLATVWREAVAAASLGFRTTPVTLGVGLSAAVLVSVLTIGLVLRRKARQSARELMAEAGGEAMSARTSGRWSAIIFVLSGLGALALAIAGRGADAVQAAGTFFGAGACLLIAGMAAMAWLLRSVRRHGNSGELSFLALAVRGAARRRKRSLATVALLASGAFLIVAISAFRLEADLGAAARSSGTGGFALLGQSALPVMRDPNTTGGQEFFGLSSNDMAGVQFVSMRLRAGDEASCLNLNRAQTPQLLGVNPEQLRERGAFTFTATAPGLSNNWSLLAQRFEDDAIPAVGDANSIQWALHKKVGDTLVFRDELGRPFKVRIAGAVANSVLQGSLLIDEAAFVRRFPGENGYRMFLIDAPSNRVSEVSSRLSRALQDVGLELTPAPRRLAQFNAVQNTYLSTFQILGGLGLILGSAGLGVVVLRNVLERRGELALLQAVGFRRARLRRLILGEHAALLLCGLGIGMVAAWLAVLPALTAPGRELPLTSLAWTLGAVLLNGLVWTWLATMFALRGSLLPALRNE